MDRELLDLDAYLKNLNRKSKNTMQAHKTAINQFESYLSSSKFHIACILT